MARKNTKGKNARKNNRKPAAGTSPVVAPHSPPVRKKPVRGAARKAPRRAPPPPAVVASPPVKKSPPGRKPGDKGRLEANKGAREKQEAKARRAFDLRCAGWTIRAIAGDLHCAPSHVHECIERVRGQLRSESLDLAAQEREVMLQQLDLAISHVVPHIVGSIDIATIKEGKSGPVTITVEEYEARMKACSALSRLVERKSKMLGADAPVKVEASAAPAAPPEVTLERARAVLQRWSFAPRAVKGEVADE